MNTSENVIEIVKKDEVNDIRSLLDESIMHIAENWISELEALRKNASDLESQVLAAVAGTKR